MFDPESFSTGSFSTQSWFMELVQAWRGQVVSLVSRMQPVITLISRMM